MNDFISIAGPWFWWIVGGILLVGELVAPGVFLIWLAAAAALTGLADLAFGLGWQAEVALFAVFSVVLVYASARFVNARHLPHSDQPHLNNRMQAYVGKSFYLESAIKHGVGKVRIDDALWDVEGPDLPVKSQVKITGIKGLRLVGERVD